MSLEIAPATADRFGAVEAILAPANPAARACWCIDYRLTPGENNSLPIEERPGRLRELCERELSPGMLATVDDEPAGWLGFGPRADLGRFARSKTILPVDDLPVWSVICFVVKPAFRGQGIARSMLEAVVSYAREHGAPALEGYPIDPGEKRIATSHSFVGTTALFESVGFERVRESGSKVGGHLRWIMRLPLT